MEHVSNIKNAMILILGFNQNINDVSTNICTYVDGTNYQLLI